MLQDLAKGVATAMAALAVLVGLGLARHVQSAEMTAGEWFKSLRVPGTSISCCDESDCKRIDDDEWRVGENGYEVVIDGRVVEVPEERVLNRPDGPIKQAVLCSLNGRVLCFRPGTLS